MQQSKSYLFGGWSQTLKRAPLPSFTTMMYGMVTNLEGLTTGTAARPGWGPKTSNAPQFENYNGSILWTYGGGLCSPKKKPETNEEVNSIICATQGGRWDGIDFDDECAMNTDRIIEIMCCLKGMNKESSYTFLAGADYNNPNSASGKISNNKVRQVIESQHCDRLIHMCYGRSMWSDDDIKRYVKQSLERTIQHGADPSKVILTLTSRGLTDYNLAYFLEQVITLEIGGLFVWAYDELKENHLQTILKCLNLSELS